MPIGSIWLKIRAWKLTCMIQGTVRTRSLKNCSSWFRFGGSGLLVHHFEVWRHDQRGPVFVYGQCMRRRTGQYVAKLHHWTRSHASWCAGCVVGNVHGRSPVSSNRLVWVSSQSSTGNMHMEYMWSFVGILSLLWLQIQSSLSIALAASPMRRIYSGPELLWLDCMLPKYVNSSTGLTALPSTITGSGVGPEPRFWIFVLVQEMQIPNLLHRPKWPLKFYEKGAWPGTHDRWSPIFC